VAKESSEKLESYEDYKKEWRKIQKRAFKARREIMMEAAKRAKVLFDHFGWTWAPPGKEKHVPSVLEIYNEIREHVYGLLSAWKDPHDEFKPYGGGSGRIEVHVITEPDEEGDSPLEIEIYLALGHVPIQYFYESSPSIAEDMKREDEKNDDRSRKVPEREC